MAKFCTKCGKKLEEGKKCSCEKVERKSEKKGEMVQKDNVHSYIELFTEIVKGIFIKPIDTIKKYGVKENFNFASLALIINAIISGMLLYLMMKESTNLLASNIGYPYIAGNMIEISFIKILLIGALFIIVGFLTTAITIYALIKFICQINIDFKKVISMIGVCSIFSSIMILVTLIFTLISIKFALIILIITGLFYLTYLYQGIFFLSTINKNKLPVIFVSTVCMTFLVVVYILPKLLF